MAATHGCEIHAHEKPLPGEEQLEDLPLFMSGLAPLEEPRAKQDINLQISVSPHAGQVHRSSLSEERTRCSKVFPH